MEKAIDYQMNEQELKKARYADKILRAYCGSYKPHLYKGEIGILSTSKESIFTVYIEGEGYFCIAQKGVKCVICNELTYKGYLTLVIKEVMGKKTTFNEIMSNTAVQHVIRN